jgi:hypothetical protein
MSIIIQGYQLRELLLGSQVIKSAQVLPADTTSTLYTVTGGNVIVTSLAAVCTTVCTATATNLSIGTHPTGGSAENASICVATAIASTALLSWLTPLPVSGQGGGSGSLVISAPSAVPYIPASFIVPAGTITLTTSATNTGAFTWYLTYIPLDTGAYVS